MKNTKPLSLTLAALMVASICAPCSGMQKMEFWKKKPVKKAPYCLGKIKKKSGKFLKCANKQRVKIQEKVWEQTKKGWAKVLDAKDIALNNKKTLGFGALAILIFAGGTGVSYKLKRIRKTRRKKGYEQELKKDVDFDKYFKEDKNKKIYFKELPKDKNIQEIKKIIKTREKMMKNAIKAYNAKNPLFRFYNIATLVPFIPSLGAAGMFGKKAYDSFKLVKKPINPSVWWNPFTWRKA